MTLVELNAADRDGFVAAIGWVFEHSPWVAERAWNERPFPSLDALYGAMVETMLAASVSEQLALLRAHPDLGTRAKMSEASTGEQAGAGLASLTAAEFERLQLLNREYRRKFDFPFLFAVRGATRHEVMAALERRVGTDRDTEFAEALRQVARIARFRLERVMT